VTRGLWERMNEEVTGGWRKYIDIVILGHWLYLGCIVTTAFSPRIIILIKSRRLKWAGYVARIESKRNVYRIFPPRRPRFKPGSGHVGFCDGQK
jgi:hypothetical protein